MGDKHSGQQSAKAVSDTSSILIGEETDTPREAYVHIDDLWYFVVWLPPSRTGDTWWFGFLIEKFRNSEDGK